jgi:hypothetical protein
MANEQRFETGPEPHVHLVQVDGSLTVEGWERTEVIVRSRHGDGPTITKVEETIRIQTVGDCSVMAPHGSLLRIDEVGGDVRITRIRGEVRGQSIGGSVRMDAVGPVQIEDVGGDVKVTRVAGDLYARNVGGTLKAGLVEGALSANTGGDTKCEVEGGHVWVNAGGNAKVTVTDLPPDGEIRIEAGGDAVCRIPVDAGAKFQAEAGGEILLKGLNTAKRRMEGEVSLTLGSGEATIHMNAGGNVILAANADGDSQAEASMEFEFNWSDEMAARAGDMTQQFTEQLEAQLENVSRQLEERMAQLANGEELAARVQQKVQAAMRRAEEKVAEAMREVERRVQHAERRSERSAARDEARRWRKGVRVEVPIPPTPPIPPRPMRPPRPQPPTVSDEERMMVLRMVEQGKISVEEAEKLLSAMQGEA